MRPAAAKPKASGFGEPRRSGPRGGGRNGAGADAGRVPAALAHADLGARNRLLEGFLSRTEIADCAHLALQWLSDELGVDRSICLVRPLRERTLVAVSSHGLPAAATATFTVSLDDWGNLLVSAVNNKRSTFFPAPHSNADRRRRPATPFERGLSRGAARRVELTEGTFGLLLLGGASELSRDSLVQAGLRPSSIRSSASSGEGDPQTGPRAHAALQHHQRRHRPDSADRHRRPSAHRERALTLFTASEEGE